MINNGKVEIGPKVKVSDSFTCILFRSLDALQLKDGTDIININRDDRAGFRLDTLAT